jgi:hypothetical protein
MPQFDDEDDEKEVSTRDALVAAFEAFDAGDLTSENAHTFELKTDTTQRDDADGGAKGADQGERGRQQNGKPDSSPATGGDKDSRDRARDQAGRFAKGEGEGEGHKPATDTKPRDGQKPDQAPQPGAQQQEQPATAAPPAAAPPPGLTPEASALWDKAAPDVRAYIAQREASLAHIAESMTPILGGAKEHNLPWNEYATRLVKADKFLRSSPLDAMLWLADQHGVDLDALADMAAAKRAGITLQPNAPQQQQHPDINRAVQPIASQVQEIASKLQQREEAEQRQVREAQEARRAAVRREMDDFASKQPHWDKVKDETFALIPAMQARLPNAGVREIMQAAYERAIYANPEVRAEMLKQEQAKAREQRRHQNSRNLEGLTDHRGTPNQQRPNGQATTLRGEIEANWAAYDSR